MKNIIAVTAVALSLSAPAFAQITDARAHFAADNASPLESRIVSGSRGNASAVRAHVVASETSVLEQEVAKAPVEAARNSSLISFFATNNDSPLEANRK